MIIKTKVITLNQIHLASQNKGIVFTNGCFDLIHSGHLKCLKEAKKMGNTLVVGLNSDRSVQNLKGLDRPIKDEHTRAEILSAFYFVDFVILFNEATPINIIKALRPDILVKGGDYKKTEIVGYDFVTSYGGQVKTVPFIEDCSTTKIIQKIRNI